MRLGLTFDMRQEYLDQGYSREETAEFEAADTVDGIEAALKELGHEVSRVGNAKSLVKALAAGQTWDLVFNIAEGLYGFGRESLVPCLLEAYQIPYTFSDPMVLAVSLHKGMCKRLIRDLGIPTADFCVVSEPSDVRNVSMAYPLFAKPVAEGTGKGISERSRVNNKSELQAVCTDLLERFHQPVLVEAYLPGREFTVGVIGTGSVAQTVGAMEVGFRKGVDQIYSYETKTNYLKTVDYSPVEPALKAELDAVTLAAWRGLGCRDGGRVDLRLDGAGRVMFLEINPLAGMNPVHSDLPILARMAGRSYVELIGAMVESARTRVNHENRRPA